MLDHEAVAADLEAQRPLPLASRQAQRVGYPALSDLHVTFQTPDGARETAGDQQQDAQVNDVDAKARKGSLFTGKAYPTIRLRSCRPSAQFSQAGLEPLRRFQGGQSGIALQLRRKRSNVVRPIGREAAAHLAPGGREAFQRAGNQIDGQQQQQQDEPYRVVDIEKLERLKDCPQCGMEPAGERLRFHLLGDHGSEQRPNRDHAQQRNGQPDGG